MYKVIIVDDELHAQEILSESIKKFFPGKFEIVAKCFSADDAFVEIQKYDPDLVFLDIQMPQKNGFELLEELIDVDFSVIFSTAYEDHMKRAFKHQPVDYLLKPIDPDEFKKTLLNFQKKQKPKSSIGKKVSEVPSFLNRGIIKLTSQKSDRIVNKNDIVYFEANGSYTNVVINDSKKFISSKNLKKYECFLEDQSFLKVSQSHIVNINFIEEFDKSDSMLRLKNKEFISVSTRFKSKLLKSFE
ncbi:LytTR family DNA-binding domain-containing protein [Belliella sp. DSM 107340]|uniref:LytTR family DNA-binding domain-containing protein n=1 Tax=Belliella calami TaxID=2923436 RepID=A0ABS9URR6_9BACT|nr:LytTR family DNA-binding domain-containing protein [Belliella calami]MCH7399208.1 LytTR family DNA-binding domain-containing protein [Belliella calami]